jgi:lipopolysaccharide transport system ATP-binding protein
MLHSSEPAITVDDVSKRYVLTSTFADRSLVDAIGSRLGSAFKTISRSARRGYRNEQREFWALRNISFQVATGEIVGIIGNNGAGKSTLLKILSRITEPTRGLVHYSGRVGSLLEVGTGFHAELSGRDNIFLNGAILGMRRQNIARRFDEIVAFAGVEKFIDEPVKRYSSGMYLRLAFAVAAHLDTDILFIDEVLAVGDIGFQKKCLARMGEVANDGRTVLFVSHNLTAIKALCRRTLALRDGKLIADGETGQVLSDYLRSTLTFDGLTTQRHWSESDKVDGEKFRMVGALVRRASGEVTDLIDVTTSFSVEWVFCNLTPGIVLSSSLVLRDQQGLVLFDIGSWDPPTPMAPGLYRTRCTIPGYLLNSGSYQITLVFRVGHEILLELPNVLQMEILESESGRGGWFGKWEGVLRPRFPWITEPLET